MSDEILHNSPALHALKRTQLVSLSKRYGLKASGKNVEMISRLQDYGSSISHRGVSSTSIPPSPGNDFAVNRARNPLETLEEVTMSDRNSKRLSDAWEVLSDSGASMISPEKQGLTNSSSMRSWRSAANGQALSEFGVESGQADTIRSKSSSMRSIASSLSRSASRHLMTRSTSASSSLATMDVEVSESAEPAEPVEELYNVPPSPASTVGVPRRYSRISLLERPSTVRLVASPPPELPITTHDDLPTFNTTTAHALKQRRSMAPLRSPNSSFGPSLTRKSMPAIHAGLATSASVPSIYPPLPRDIPPVPPIPGAWKPSLAFEPHPPKPQPSPATPFTFSISNEQFEDAGKKVLAEMDAKLKANLGEKAQSFGSELLKGKKAELNKLVSVREGLGESGWGLSCASKNGIEDRYAEAHGKEFERMESIGNRRAQPVQTPGKRKHSNGRASTPSAPNGMSLEASAAESRQNKRSRLSPGPNALGSIRGAGRSLVNLLGDTPRKRGTPSYKTKERLRGSRFNLFKTKHADATEGSSTAPPIPAPILKRSATVATLAPARTVGNTSTGANNITSHLRRASKDFSTVIKRMPDLPEVSAPLSLAHEMVPRARNASSSAQTVMSTSSSMSKLSARPRIPDFAPGGSTSSRPSSGFFASTMSMRKQSQADLIRGARPAPAPPASLASSTRVVANSTSQMKRSSTLLMPTASSLARMQATVKPTEPRPLSVLSPPPSIATTRPFGVASSRANFDSSFNVPAPTKLAFGTPGVKLAIKSPSSPAKTPGKSASSAAARSRQRASGLSAVKLKGNLRDDKDVLARRREIRARQERMGEERELRQLLGAGNEENMPL